MEDIIKEMRSIASRPATETTGRLPMWGILTLRRCWAGWFVCMCFEIIRYKHFCILDVRVCTHIYFHDNTYIYIYIYPVIYKRIHEYAYVTDITFTRLLPNIIIISFQLRVSFLKTMHNISKLATLGRLRGESPKRSQQQTVISWPLGVNSLNRGTSTDGSQPIWVLPKIVGFPPNHPF